MIRFRLLLVCCLAFAPFLSAQSDKVQTEAETRLAVQENVTVWATEVTLDTFKRDDQVVAMKQPDHISDLLRGVPGVDVGGAHSLNQRITMRSLGDRDLVVTIDGARQNSYMYHHMGNLQIHADILKSVAMDLGAGSVVHSGLGGSVRMETKDAADLLRDEQHFGARLQSNYADNSAASVNVAAFGRGDHGLDFLAYYNFVDRNNFRVGGDRIRDAAGDEIPRTDGKVRGLAGELGDGLVKLGWDATATQRFELSFERYRDQGDYSYRPDMGLATDLAIAAGLGVPLLYPTEFERDTVALNHQTTWSDHTRVESVLYFNESNLNRDESGLAAVFGGASDVRGRARNSGLRVTARTLVEGSVAHQLTYGADVNRYKTRYESDADEFAGERLDQQALFIEVQLPLAQGVTLTPGLRYERVAVAGSLVDDDFDAVTGALALVHEVNDAFSWRVHARQLFKAPEIGEVFGGAGLYDTPNPEIKDERGLNAELGLAYQTEIAGYGRFSANLSLFRTEITDYIDDYAPHPTQRSWQDNIGDMRIDGGELTLAFQARRWDLTLAFDQADSDLAADPAYAALDGVRLDTTQGETTALEIGVQLPRTGLKLHWDSLFVGDVAAGRVLDGATRDNAKQSYAVHNLSARWSPAALPGLAATFGIDNLFDRFYASHSSRTGVSFHPRFGELYLLDYEPGRNVKATLSYSF